MEGGRSHRISSLIKLELAPSFSSLVQTAFHALLTWIIIPPLLHFKTRPYCVNHGDSRLPATGKIANFPGSSAVGYHRMDQDHANSFPARRVPKRACWDLDLVPSSRLFYAAHSSFTSSQVACSSYEFTLVKNLTWRFWKSVQTRTKRSRARVPSTSCFKPPAGVWLPVECHWPAYAPFQLSARRLPGIRSVTAWRANQLDLNSNRSCRLFQLDP